MSTDPRPFDVTGPLPSGTTVLEASAGTGKTYTIAALAARYVAEGRAELSEVMVVTFGRMATSELRARVRERLTDTERALSAALAAPASPTGDPEEDPEPPADPIRALLTTGPAHQLRDRRERVRRALRDFDAATIATTHEFCLHMLDGLGVLGDREPERRVVEHLTELTREVAGDVYLRRYAAEEPPIDYPTALELADRVVETGQTRLVPVPPPRPAGDAEVAGGERLAYQRAAYGADVRAEVEHRRRAGLLFTYDDMLSRLRDALTDPAHGDAAVRRLRQRYRVVLVDEFQDTDPIQWEIVRRAFHGHVTMVLIGDPKQAIYAFRGADVFSYLDAVGTADTVATLDTNWRSDGPLLTALDRLMGGAALGDPRIVVRPVTAAHPQSRLSRPPAGGPPAAPDPIRLRVIPYDAEAAELRKVDSLRPAILSDLVADIGELLTSPAAVTSRTGPRPLEPSDVAVLVRRNERGEAVRDALIGAGIPAVLLSANSVFGSPAAREWLTLLRTLEQPRPQAVRQAALTWFVGWTFADLVLADDEQMTALTQRIRSWSGVLSRRGVAALVERIGSDTRLGERLLAEVGGERRLTDLRHLGQSLHTAMQAGQLGVNALVEWLRERIADAHRRAAPEGSRRLDTDARCVQVLTVHASKGLEFGVVYLPEAWDNHVTERDRGQILLLHETGAGDRVLDIGGATGPGRRDRLARHQAEAAGEELRLLYVALTRARHQVVTWWAPSWNTRCSALQRFLFRRPVAAGEGAEPDPSYPVRADPCTAPDAGGPDLDPLIHAEPVTLRPQPDLQQERFSPGLLRARTFDRVLDDDWRRTSYSALTAAAHGVTSAGPSVGSEPEPGKEDDEPGALPARSVAPGATAGLDRVSPMSELPTGAAFGTIVHAVLEAVDPGSAELAEALLRAASEQIVRFSPGGPTAEELAAGLLPALTTSLGTVAGGASLAGIGSADRLCELAFELPLAGGERPSGRLDLGAVAELLRRRLPAGDPLAGYPDRLAHPLLAQQTLRGFLTGSIDAVLRLRPPAGDPRYLVVDYKTNWLGPVEEGPLTLAAYAQPRLAEAMMAAHYPLQALLYSVALHRMLRWRQPGYDPHRHLGGIAYLFLRGMAGPDTPTVDGQPCGVFAWRPDPGLITELSDLLDTGIRAGSGRSVA